jgi:hypothetical protein
MFIYKLSYVQIYVLMYSYLTYVMLPGFQYCTAIHSNISHLFITGIESTTVRYTIFQIFSFYKMTLSN